MVSSATENSGFLDPSPRGWFAIAASHEIPLNAERRGVLCAKPYSVRRCRQGGFSFTGAITAIVEQNGFIFAWHHPSGLPPEWHLPVLDESGWRPLQYCFLRAKSHPQETFENSIDLAHFPIVHGFNEIKVLQPMQLDRHTMSVRYQIARDNPVPFIKAKVTPSFEVCLHGIGIAHNHIFLPDLKMQIRMFALSTPTEPGRVELRIGVSIYKKIGLPFSRLLLPVIHWSMKRSIVHDFCQDIAIWENKHYLRPPLIVQHDGPIGQFRQWAKQFYCLATEAGAEAEGVELKVTAIKNQAA